MALSLSVMAQQSKSVWIADGKLQYGAFPEGDRVPDFSPVGFGGGGTAIPNVPESARIAPSGGTEDDTARVQKAIDSIGKLPLNEGGFRGALVFDPGAYRIGGKLTVGVDGIVLRGSGSASSGTVLIATGDERRPLIEAVGGSEPIEDESTITQMAQARVPVGASTIELADASSFSVGDRVRVSRPASDQWISDIGMDDLPPRPEGGVVSNWTAEGYVFNFEREITAIAGNVLTLDAPMPQALDQKYGGGHVVKYAWPDRLQNVGFENLRLVSEYAEGQEESDEAHATEGILINRAENIWVRDVVAKHFVRSAVTVDRHARFVTVEDSLCLDPASRITGGRRYSFYLIGQRSLVQRCATRGGRHDFITGSRTGGPNAFVDCLAVNTHEDIGPHHRWAMGTLWDNIRGGVIRARNRANRGTGHGWAGAQNVLWNCEGSSFTVQSPPTSWNLAVGCIGDRVINEYKGEDGIYESHGKHVEPRSLFIAQLQERYEDSVVRAIVSPSQLNGSIFKDLHKRLDAEKVGRDESL